VHPQEHFAYVAHALCPKLEYVVAHGLGLATWATRRASRRRGHAGQGHARAALHSGSSLFGAQLAARLGLPYAFASHFAPDLLEQAVHLYRRDFRPSAQLEASYVIAGLNVLATDTRAKAEEQLRKTCLVFRVAWLNFWRAALRPRT